MSSEFSLLQHLGVSVDRAATDAPAAAHPSAADGTCGDAVRVWAPANHPPSRSGRSDETRHALEKRRKGPQVSYADPTGEVLLRREHGAEVQYVVYNSKAPSVYGVNRRLAERKKAEKEREAHSALVNYGLEFGEDESRQEAARREVLRELRRCNQEQAQLKREEERRERERRIAHERALLQYTAAEALRQEEEVSRQKASREAESRAAMEAAVSSRREAQRAAAQAEGVGVSAAPWCGEDEDERRRRGAEERRRQCAEENFRAAALRRAERKAQVEAERASAQAERAALQRQLADEHARALEKHQRDSAALRCAHEAEQERRWREEAAAAGSRSQPCGSLFSAVEKRERDEALRARRQVIEDASENARLAASKRAAAEAEKRRERQYAADCAQAELESFRRDVEQERQRRQREQVRLQEAAAAAAATRKAKADEAKAREETAQALLFWKEDRALSADAAKAAEARRFHEDLRRQANRKRAERARDAEQERSQERALLEYDMRVAEETAAREHREAQAKAAELRHSLEWQMEMKREAAEKERRAAAVADVTHVPAAEAKALYRCPVTGDLLPASAYDFGVQRGR